MASRLIKVGGQKFDEAIKSAVRKEYNLMIGSKTAEKLKVAMREVQDSGKGAVVYGRDIVLGLPVEKEIDTGANFYGTYEQEAAVLGVGATVPACPPTAFHSGETIVLSKGSHIILKSPKFVGANISRSGSLSGIWFHQDSIIDVYVPAQLPSGYTNSISSLPFPNSMTFTGTYPNDCEVFRFKLNLTDVIPLLPLSMQVTPSGTGYNITLQRSSPKEIAEADSEDNSLYNISDWNLTIVHSLSGKTVFDNRVAGVQKHVNTAGWLPGVYVVRAQIGDEVVTQKIFVAQ